jgi:hypothetical protein
MLLYFDQLAILVPAYLRNKPFAHDPKTMIPLADAGLLTVIEPEEVVDKAATERLASSLVDIIASGALDSLTGDGAEFHELSWSRLGGYGDAGLAQMIFDELKARGLAKQSRDGFSIPLHPIVRNLVLLLLAQILRSSAAPGQELSPVTDRPGAFAALRHLLNVTGSPAAGQVVTMDLQVLGVDLKDVPVGDLLSFRRDHLAEYRDYSVSVKRFVRDLSMSPPGDIAEEMAARRRQLRKVAARLQKDAVKTWKNASLVALGICGAAWTLKTGDPIGAALGVGGALVSWEGSEAETGAFSYLFRAKDSYA